MFRDQVETGNGKKCDQHDVAPGPEIARRRIPVFLVSSVLHGMSSSLVLGVLVWIGKLLGIDVALLFKVTFGFLR